MVLVDTSAWIHFLRPAAVRNVGDPEYRVILIELLK